MDYFRQPYTDDIQKEQEMKFKVGDKFRLIKYSPDEMEILESYNLYGEDSEVLLEYEIEELEAMKDAIGKVHTVTKLWEGRYISYIYFELNGEELLVKPKPRYVEYINNTVTLFRRSK